jgi:DNA-binding transcriptional regulator GbsR (MarR family)
MRDSLANSLLSPTLIPQAIKAPIEVGINYNFFQGRPLIGEFEKKKEAERQFNESTSQLAKLFSKAPVYYSFERNQWQSLSPIAIDHLIRGMFGTMGGLVTYTSNFFLQDPEVERPTVSFREAMATFPGASGVFTKDQEAGLKNDFYVLRDETTKAASTFSDIKNRSPQEIDKMLKDEKLIARYGLNKSVEKIAKELSEVRKQINQVSNLPKDVMKREEKDKLIKELRAAESEILKTINVKELRKEAKL